MLWQQEGAAHFLTGPRFLSLELGGCVGVDGDENVGGN